MRPHLWVLLLAFLLNLNTLAAAHRFHPDEAFYMMFARNAAVNGDWWLSGALDKPPLTLYLNAVALIFFAVDADANGVLHLDVYKGEFAARITGVLVGVLCVAVLMRLAYQLYQSAQRSVITGLLLALSPYMLAFAPTAFTDMPMLLFSLVSLLCAAQHRPLWSGIAFMLAFAAKPQAIFFVPLLFIFQLSVAGKEPIQSIRFGTKDYGLRTFNSARWLFPVLIGGGLLWLWDTLRPDTSVFVLGAVNNGHATLFSALADFPARWAIFWHDAQWLLGNGITTTFALAIAGIGIISRKNCFNTLIALWLIGYVALHLVTSLNLYDRYWLLLLPGMALLTADSMLARSPQSVTLRQIAKIIFFVALFFSAILERPAIGSDKGRYTGIDELANYLNAKPVATVIYDRWLGWQLGYYMGQWTNKRRVYFPTPHALAQGALALPETGTRYLIAPTWEDVDAWLTALQAAQFEVILETHIAQFEVYAILPPINHP